MSGVTDDPNDRPGDMNLPFEHNPKAFDTTLDADTVIASGVIVLAIAAPIPDAGTMPGLVFRFANPDGSGFYPAIALICAAEDLAGIVDLVAHATHAAITVAGQS